MGNILEVSPKWEIVIVNKDFENLGTYKSVKLLPLVKNHHLWFNHEGLDLKCLVFHFGISLILGSDI